MGPRFDDVIPYFGDTVLAIGPLFGPKGTGDRILEVCAWVYQPIEDRTRDVAATEMTTNKPAGRAGFRQTFGARWMLPLFKLKPEPADPPYANLQFRDGRAFAVAVAFAVESPTAVDPRVVWWGQPVFLKEDRDRIELALARDAADNILESGLLSEPMAPVDVQTGS